MAGFREQRITVQGVEAAVWDGGGGLPILLMHGAGPGTSIAANFGKVLDRLAKRYHVFATDMIGFGASGRKTERPLFDYDLWLAQMQAVLDLMPGKEVGILGHSIGASFAFRLAARNERVAKILATGAMGTSISVNEHLEQLWTFPRTETDLRRSLEVLFFDHAIITPELIRQRLAVLSEGTYGDYFDEMFGGEKDRLIKPTVLHEDELTAVRCEVRLIHGRSDLAFPIEETSECLARALRHADLHALARCGHGPAAERTETFMALTLDFFG